MGNVTKHRITIGFVIHTLFDYVALKYYPFLFLIYLTSKNMKIRISRMNIYIFFSFPIEKSGRRGSVREITTFETSNDLTVVLLKLKKAFCSKKEDSFFIFSVMVYAFSYFFHLLCMHYVDSLY